MVIDKLTVDNLLLLSAQTEDELDSFIKSPKRPTLRKVTGLAFKLVKEMGLERNMIRDLIMMQTLRQLWEDEHKDLLK